jgi:hypothetical protein
MAYKSFQILLAILITSLSGTAVAIPISYDINFIASSGTGGSGAFTVDSTVLAAMPATGYYESSYVFSTGEAIWDGGTVSGLFFDGTWTNGFATLIAADGLTSDITALANDGLISFDSLGGYNEHELYLEANGRWNLYSYWPYVENFEQRRFLAEGVYTISRVSEPSIITLLGLGMAAIGFVRRKKAT